ncbi:hypothetical protein [Streptomyces sp. SGAir0957]
MPPRLRFFFSAGVVGTALWPDDTDSPYGYPCELERLPISRTLREALVGLSERYQTSIDWDYPPGPTPWSRRQQDEFTRQADAALRTLRRELGGEWTVVDQRHTL